jgi:hypothetical protein
MSITGLALFLVVLAFLHGSFEMYPTEEQHGKARFFWSFFALPLIAVEALLFALLRYVQSKAQPDLSLQSEQSQVPGRGVRRLGWMFKGWFTLLLIPLAAAAWVLAALVRVWDIWFLNDAVFAGFWAAGAFIPYIVCFIGILVGIRARMLAMVSVSTAAAVLLVLPGFWLSETLGEGTLAGLTLLPFYAFAVLLLALLVIGLWAALATRNTAKGDRSERQAT